MIIFAVALWVTIQGSSYMICFQMKLDMGVGGYFKTHDFAIEVWCSTAHALIYHKAYLHGTTSLRQAYDMT